MLYLTGVRFAAREGWLANQLELSLRRAQKRKHGGTRTATDKYGRRLFIELEVPLLFRWSNEGVFALSRH